jgi:hypothetical protein
MGLKQWTMDNGQLIIKNYDTSEETDELLSYKIIGNN